MWTENAGRLLAWASGGPHEDVLYWWSNFHHTIYFGSTPHEDVIIGARLDVSLDG